MALETHRVVFTWVLRCLGTSGLVKGKTIGVDATTLEANAALRSIVRRDTTTLPQTAADAVQQLDQVADAKGDPVPLGDEIVADKGCHSRAALLELSQHFRTCISEPDRRRRCWRDHPMARDAVYANRRRIRSPRGGRLLRRGRILGTHLRARL
jgi:hypothetical protein